MDCLRWRTENLSRTTLSKAVGHDPEQGGHQEEDACWSERCDDAPSCGFLEALLGHGCGGEVGDPLSEIVKDLYLQQLFQVHDIGEEGLQGQLSVGSGQV